MATNLSDHKAELAHELLDDIELSRLPPEALLLKARRLARVTDATDVDTWLKFELNGYPGSEAGRKYMSRMGRWTNKEKTEGYWIPLASVEGNIAAMQTQIQQLQVPNIHFAPSSSNPVESVTGARAIRQANEPATAVLLRLNNLTTAVSTLRGIRSRVLAALHDFAMATYYELAFSTLAESLFELHKRRIDALLAETAGEAMKKVPAIYDRLMADDPEAVSQALNSCRRMIKAFADGVYPPGEGIVEVEGQAYQIGSDKVLNRIKLYLLAHCPSSSRRDRLSRGIRDIYERASAGAHAEASSEEARSLFLATYMMLGEILLASGLSLTTPNPQAATDGVPALTLPPPAG